MDKMDFDFYRNFVVVAEQGNVTAAARKLSLAQPALRAQIKTLEEHYGTKLIITGRGVRQLTLTETGRLFLEKARQICALEENWATEVNSYLLGNIGTLRFTTSISKTTFFLRNYLQPFAENYPSVRYEIREATVTEQLKDIDEGYSNFAFANAPLPLKQNYGLLPSGQEDFYVVYQKNNKINFTAGETTTLAELRNMPLFCNFSCLQILSAHCLRQGFKPNIVFTSTTKTAAQEFARNGNGIGIVSFNKNEVLCDDLCYSKIIDEGLFYEVMLFWSLQREMPPHARAFLNFYKEKVKV
ncbi:MAG: LysR family transcriptional regulator [Eubacteriales bacterium]|nr:LysR family transcriptional regulator [Acidaminococcaceae bacterium]MDD4422680.1 LysR family transcriptional regulator [Eubacteriales bacterium]NLC51489.1 LysR family transcriptional regulator [Bacillota bacterium]NLF84336.1 LysR family transcriptional regulator [Candidatus Gastranaerophilales bacterium]